MDWQLCTRMLENARSSEACARRSARQPERRIRPQQMNGERIDRAKAAPDLLVAAIDRGSARLR
jgi:hypothetical protein